MTKKKVFTYQSKFYHNKHSEQRDKMLIEMYGETWLNDMKAKGYFGGDTPDDLVDTLKDMKSGYFDENGEFVTINEVFIDEE